MKLRHRAARYLGSLLNVEIIPAWRLESFPHARFLQQLFDEYEVSTVLDVGANAGQFGHFLRREVEFRGSIVSFEPVSSSFRTLEKACAGDSDWSALQLALGREAGRAQINVAEYSQCSSFLTASTMDTDAFAKPSQPVRHEQVEVRKLDQTTEAFLPRTGRRASLFLKLDTQGYDLEVLAGADETLQHVSVLQTEVPLLHIYEGMPSLVDVLDTVKGLGFAIAGFFPVNHDRRLRLVEADLVFVRNAKTSGYQGGLGRGT
jgi:FkbM family methyltransferase